MSTFKVELTEKIDEARGLLSNLIFGRKQKKPREMIETIKAYLQQLAIQQQLAQAQAVGLTSPQAIPSSLPTPSSGAAVGTNVGSMPPSPNMNQVTVASSTTTTPTLTPSHQQVQQNSPLLTSTNIASPSNTVHGAAPMSLNIPSPANGITMLPSANGETISSQQLQTPQSATSPSQTVESSNITADLDQMVMLLYGDPSADSTSGGVPDPRSAKEVIDLMFEADLFRRLLENIRYLEFEGRKFFTKIFEYALTQRRDLSVPYVLHRRHLLYLLIHAYDEKDASIALACDAILRACIACEQITEMILTSGQLADGNTDPTSTNATIIPEQDMVLLWFRYLDLPTFINSHAFASFKLLLQSHPHLSSAYLLRTYPIFFAHFNRLLCSENYLTKVQAFQLLGEILMERSNQEIMMRYVNEAENLKLAMMALRGPKAIQLAVFNVLKVFVPNPYKADSILRILTQNKRNFLAFLDEFERDSEDEVLVAHKQEMIQSLLELPDSVTPTVKKSNLTTEEQQQQQQQQQPTQQVPISDKEELP